ncbi:MAG TPA: efflux RND transporter permease subunit [Chitinophagaceae bacterium]|nr:efflux RND transporter permease subunit [Chitinophagaceae bacterium]MCB9055828.1 efflux RND transporter permease subunit [Chitinophagales bacterium]HPG11025.1 efflux RND transporter permease subunit [Chitinophagaceae bacterium]
MNLSELSLRRPVLAMVCSIVIIIFGIIGYKFLGVREYPAIDPAVINVRTSYAGANADIIEQQITEPIEKAVNGVQGVKNITSSSSQGSSNITVEFELNVDLEQAANDVRDKVSQVIGNLPQDLDSPPIVSKADAESDPIMYLQIQSQTKGLMELTDYTENVVQERLQTIQGVSSINVFGRRYSMRLWIDPAKLSAYKLTIEDIRQALNRENVELPGGKIRGNETQLIVKTFGKLSTEEDFNTLILREDNAGIVRFKDVGYAELAPSNEEQSSRKNNIPSVNMGIVPQPGSNQVAIADEVYKRIEEIKKDMPEDILLEVGYDKTTFVRNAIFEVKETLIIAIILVVIIIFLFFREWTIAFRPLIDIPVSLLGAFFIMYVMGYSMNVLTLLAIVLATGLVVDDGIVVTENIFKKMEMGMNKHKAALEGSKEIYFAVIATSLTLVIVFLPIIFLQGFVGRLFREFGIVVAGAVLISAFVSLSLTPVLNIYLTRKGGHKHSRFYHATEPFFTGMENLYRRTLQAFMKLRWIAFVIVLFCGAIIYFIGKDLPSELAPMEDRNRIRVRTLAPEGSDFDFIDQATVAITQEIIDSIPEKDIVLSFAPSFGGGANGSIIPVGLTDASERKRSQEEIAQQMNRMFRKYKNVQAFAIQEQTISVGGGRGSFPVQFVLQNLDFDKLKEKIPAFMEEVRQSPVFQGYDINLKFNQPELLITIDRLRANELGVSVLDVSNTLQLAFSGRRFGYFIKSGKQYEVIAQVERIDRDDPLDLKTLFVRNNRGELIQLDNVVNIEESANPSTIYHFNRFKNATVSAGLAEGKTIGDGVAEMQRIADKVLDESFSTALAGASRDYAESSSNTSFAFFLALGLIFLLLSAQFESFIDPFIIMITVPLALAGAVLSMWIFGQTLNIFSQIGIIMLIGLVTKNGILIVEFANQKRRKGEAKIPAAMDAAVARFRPILMTTLATTLGALPIALAIGSAGSSRVPLGIVIIGGMLFSLVLTLYVVPALYSYLSSKKKVTDFEKAIAEGPGA